MRFCTSRFRLTAREEVDVRPETTWPRWPDGMQPSQSPVFVHNECAIPAPPAVVWQWLCRADLWPSWFKQCRDVRFEAGGGTGAPPAVT